MSFIKPPKQSNDIKMPHHTPDGIIIANLRGNLTKAIIVTAIESLTSHKEVSSALIMPIVSIVG